MIGWLNPAALWGLLMLAGPIAVHLLRRQQAVRLPFPSLRFLRSSQSAAIRLRRPSDVTLLLVRCAIVAAAVIASAQPVLLTGLRTARWNARVARAIVVDTSARMNERTPSGVTALDVARGTADAESHDAFHATRIETPDLRTGLIRAADALKAAPPARHEIVVISDFALGRIDAAAIAGVASGTGLRFVRVPHVSVAADYDPNVVTFEGRAWQPRVRLDHNRTGMTLVARESPPVNPDAAAVVILGGPQSRDAADRMLRAALSLGAPPADASRRITLVCADTPANAVAGVAHVAAGWMAQAALRLKQNASLASAARDTVGPSVFPSDEEPWTTVAWGPRGPVVRASTRDGSLLLQVAADVRSDLALVSARAALLARGATLMRADVEPLTLGDAQLSTWERPAGPAGSAAWRNVSSSDARWAWAAVLCLLALESWMRREHRRAIEVGVAAA